MYQVVGVIKESLMYVHYLWLEWGEKLKDFWQITNIFPEMENGAMRLKFRQAPYIYYVHVPKKNQPNRIMFCVTWLNNVIKHSHCITWDNHPKIGKNRGNSTT